MQGLGQRFLFPLEHQLFSAPPSTSPVLPPTGRRRRHRRRRLLHPGSIPFRRMLRAKRQGNKKGTRAYLRKLGCVGFWLAGAADVVEEEAAGEAVLSARVEPGVGSGVIWGGGAGRG